jgi:hypothetical protein
MLYVLEEKYQSRAPGRRPRDPEKERILTQLDRARWQRYLDSGEVQIIGPRLWRWRIDVEPYGKRHVT